MKLEGSLDAFSLPDIFQLLSFTKKSGGLRLSSGASAGVVYFAEGLVTGATADGSRQALARRLIGSGVVDDATLEGAVASAGDGTGVGRWLLEHGALDAELVKQAATEQTVDAVFDLLRWSAGDFAFHGDLPNPDDVDVRLATEAVVGEVTARQGAWDAAAAVIPGPDTLLTMPVVLGVEPNLTRDEWALLALVDGRRRVGDLVELTGCGQYAVVSTLAGMVTRGLLQVAGDDDHVATVLRRQALLATLEHRDPVQPVTAGQAGGAAEVEPPVVAERPEEQPAADPTPAVVAEPEDVDSEAVEASPGPGAPAAAAAPSEWTQDGADPVRAVTELAVVPEQATEPAEVLPEDPAAADSPAARAPSPLLGRAHVPRDVVPPRPEPFLPQRKPEHPESAPAARLSSVASPVVGATAIAADPETAGLIERDPSVNRSLLLRLIAGVRGL